MKTIKILWTWCANCKVLEANVKTTLDLIWLDAKVEKVEDIASIMTYDLMWTPWLVIDEKLISSWKILSVDELKEVLSWNKIEDNTWKSKCSCGSNS